MVFLIQNTQNRDARATQIKLDELVKNLKGARNSLVNIEELSEDDELDKLQEEFQNMRTHYESKLAKIAEVKKKRQHKWGGK